MKTIKLTHDLETTVDDSDYEVLSENKWAAYRISGTSRTGKVHIYGYKAGRKFKGKRMWIHNIIMNPPIGTVVDHIDRNPLNNVRDNLRICTIKDNSFNRGKRSNGLTSRFLGVHKKKKKNKFQASITFNDKNFHLGYFDNELEAAKAYNLKATELFGSFASLNIIE